MICARDAAALEAAAGTLEREVGRRPLWRAVDLSRPDAAQAFAGEAAAALGGVDILVCNVGGPPPSAAVDTSLDAWRRGFDQLFLSTAVLAQSLVPGMRERRFGRVVVITSLSVVEPIDHLVVSTAMRSAVTGFAKTLATEVARDGVTVNTVMPGVIHTQRIEDLRKAKAEREGSTLASEMSQTAATIPARRLGRPEELGDLVAFLASERAGYITGANVAVDGGLRRSW
jgi:3-oxoacyl-[acyl-carrier protein] reductase